MEIKPRLYMVDVFAEQPYSGNQLAVFFGTEALSDETMQQLAAEMNFSETTFVTSSPRDNGAYPVRIFTPAREIAFTGHPILGTAWVLKHHIIPDSPSEVLLDFPVGTISVTFESQSNDQEIVWFQAPPMSLGPTAEHEPMAQALGLSADDIDTTTPIQVISAKTSAMIVPLRSLDALRRSKLNLEAFSDLSARGFPPLVYLYTRQTHQPQNDFCVRFFFEAHGVREDPATGNGAAFFGAYLLEHQTVPDCGLSLRIEQGHEIHRPSLIRLRAGIQNEGQEIRVGGQVIPTLQGKLE